MFELNFYTCSHGIFLLVAFALAAMQLNKINTFCLQQLLFIQEAKVNALSCEIKRKVILSPRRIISFLFFSFLFFDNVFNPESPTALLLSFA